MGLGDCVTWRPQSLQSLQYRSPGFSIFHPLPLRDLYLFHMRRGEFQGVCKDGTDKRFSFFFKFFSE